MPARTLDLNFASYVFDGSHPALIRDRLGKAEDRHPSYDERYDFKTLIYDSFYDPDAREIVLICPPLLNFRRLVERTEFALDGRPLAIKAIRDISRGSLITFDAGRNPPETLAFQHPLFSGSVAINPTHTDLFAGKNAIYAISKDNRLEWLDDWLTYYVRAHGANAVVIYDNQSTAYTIDELTRTLAAVPGIDIVAIGRAWFPFGPRGVSNVDYKSLFLQRTMAELGRRRILSKSRAVLNVDIDELMYSRTGQSIFDAAVEAPEGYVRADAEWVYADPPRRGAVPRFHQHRYVSARGRPKSNRKWCVATQGPQQGKQWLTHFINSRRDPVNPDFFMWHFSQISTGWKYDRSGGDGPKLKENAELITAMQRFFPDKGYVPPPSPAASAAAVRRPAYPRDNMLIITSMKGEGPFILEWIAYHRVIGFNQFLVYTNDCEDGTDTILDRMQDLGLVVHQRNKVLRRGPQKSALKYAREHTLSKNADWILVSDIDEFLNIKTGAGHINDLLDAVPDADVIPVTWRLFSHNGLTGFADEPVIAQFTDAETDIDAGGKPDRFVKSIFKNSTDVLRFGTHGPLYSEEYGDTKTWIAPDGRVLGEEDNLTRPEREFGYEVAQFNHYATRSVDSFLIKKDRGRVNHFRQSMDIDYWRRMCRGGAEDRTILRHLDAVRAEIAGMMKDDRLRALHEESVAWHHAKIKELRSQAAFAELRRKILHGDNAPENADTSETA